MPPPERDPPDPTAFWRDAFDRWGEADTPQALAFDQEFDAILTMCRRCGRRRGKAENRWHCWECRFYVDAMYMEKERPMLNANEIDGYRDVHLIGDVGVFTLEYRPIGRHGMQHVTRLVAKTEDAALAEAAAVLGCSPERLAVEWT